MLQNCQRCHRVHCTGHNLPTSPGLPLIRPEFWHHYASPKSEVRTCRSSNPSILEVWYLRVRACGVTGRRAAERRVREQQGRAAHVAQLSAAAAHMPGRLPFEELLQCTQLGGALKDHCTLAAASHWRAGMGHCNCTCLVVVG